MTTSRSFTRRARAATAVVLACALAALSAAAAPAASPTLTLKAERVDALKATVLTARNGRTLYRLSGETASHLLCTSSACLGAWHPLTVRSKSTVVHLPHGLAGHGRLLRRGRSYQVMLGRDPLYTFAGDSGSGQANGQDIRSFGGTWHAITVTKDAAAPAPAPMPAPYPPY